MKKIKNLVPLFVILVVFISCEQTGYGDPPVLKIGDLSSRTILQGVFSPALELTPTENRNNTLSLDIDADQNDDIQFNLRYDYVDNDPGPMYWDVTGNIRISVLPLSTAVKFCIKYTKDTSYYCTDENGPDYSDYEFTENTGYTCNTESYVYGIKQVIEGDYCQDFLLGASLTQALNWHAGELKIAKREYWIGGDNEHNVTYNNRKDLRLGLSDWTASTYIGLSITEDKKTFFGYIKLKLVQIDDFEWKLQILETVVVK